MFKFNPDQESTYYRLSSEDYWKFERYKQVLEKKLKLRNTNELEIFQKMMGLLVEADWEHLMVLKKEFAKKLDEVYARFKDDPEYKFEIKFEKKISKEDRSIYGDPMLSEKDELKKQYKDVKSHVIYDTRGLIEKALDIVYFLHKKYNYPKEQCICISFQVAKEYRNNFPKKAQREFLSDYKLKVIAGYIAICLGYHLTNRKPLINKYIEESTKNSIKKLSKYPVPDDY